MVSIYTIAATSEVCQGLTFVRLVINSQEKNPILYII